MIDFWDVGQGDASTVTSPDGSLTVIDVGPSNNSFEHFLNDPRKQHKIECLILTHNDLDHVGGLNTITSNISIQLEKVFLLDDDGKNDSRVGKLIGKLSQKTTDIERLECKSQNKSVLHSWGGYTLEVRYPNFVQNIKATTPNITSAIIVLCWKDEVRIIWGADNSISNINQHTAPSSEILFGPHHGAPNNFKAPAEKMALNSLSPQRCFISVGTNNKYKHPKYNYIRNLANFGCQAMCSPLNIECLKLNNNTDLHDSAGLYCLRKSEGNSYQCCGHLRFYLRDGAFSFDHFSKGHEERIKNFSKYPPCRIQ